MSRNATRSLLAQLPLSNNSSIVYRRHLPCLRQFSKSTRRRAEDDIPSNSQSTPLPSTESATQSPSGSPPTTTTQPASNPSSRFSPLGLNRSRGQEPEQLSRHVSPSINPKAMSSLGGIFDTDSQQRGRRGSKPVLEGPGDVQIQKVEDQGIWHLHIYAHKHNTHITLTRPDGNPVVALSNGNIGFRHSSRKNYDASFQLAVYTMNRIHERGLHVKIKELEVVLSGFGKGRDAVTKVLMGSEGRFLRGKVIKVADATKLKFGGVRSKNVRRL